MHMMAIYGYKYYQIILRVHHRQEPHLQTQCPLELVAPYEILRSSCDVLCQQGRSGSLCQCTGLAYQG